MRVAVALVAAAVVAAALLAGALALASLYVAVAGRNLFAGHPGSPGDRGLGLLYAVLLAASCVALALVARATLRRPEAPLPEPRTPAARLLAGLLALPAMAFGLWVSLLAMLFGAVAAQWPDPEVPDGDPCCGHPDDWGEVAGGLAYGIGTGAVALALVVTGVVLAAFAGTGRIPGPLRRRPRPVRLAGALCLALAALVPGSWLVFALARGDYP